MIVEARVGNPQRKNRFLAQPSSKRRTLQPKTRSTLGRTPRAMGDGGDSFAKLGDWQPLAAL
jgi:hypothetical protein